MWMKWDPIKYYFYGTLIVVLSWPEDGRSWPKHVAKYNLTVIIASCLMYVVYWRCIIHYTNITLQCRLYCLQVMRILLQWYCGKLPSLIGHYTLLHVTESHNSEWSRCLTLQDQAIWEYCLTLMVESWLFDTLEPLAHWCYESHWEGQGPVTITGRRGPRDWACCIRFDL
jgi:hypothetical protein